MKFFSRERIVIICLVCSVALGAVVLGADQNDKLAEQARLESLRPIHSGQPGIRPFWNEHARKFIYAPSFDFKAVDGAAKYQFLLKTSGKEYQFEAAVPWAALTPVWDNIPEGNVNLTVQALDKEGKVLGTAGERSFYRGPLFSPSLVPVDGKYEQAGESGLQAIFTASHVQYWLTHTEPDREYSFYCYPAKVMGGLIRAMAAWARVAPDKKEREQAQLIARRVADHLISISMPSNSPVAFFPPTYSTNVANPKPAAPNNFAERLMMVPAACDAALAYLDLFDVVKDPRYLEAAKRIADTYANTQEADGTWPLKINFETGRAAADNRLVPTWVISLFDRLDRQYQVTKYRPNRQRAWKYIADNPLRTFAWDAQFEDVKPQKPYRNLAREQACDVAVILLDQAKGDANQIATAKELLWFAEDQFVVWSPVKGRMGNSKAKPNQHGNSKLWITPAVLEQYLCYAPVARSSAVLIKAYLKAYDVTKDAIFLRKAQALASGLITGQKYQIEQGASKGEIPTWLIRIPPVNNWLNNSFYASEALLDVAKASGQGKAPAR